jgi:hypothetical protein
MKLTIWDDGRPHSIGEVHSALERKWGTSNEIGNALAYLASSKFHQVPPLVTLGNAFYKLRNPRHSVVAQPNGPILEGTLVAETLRDRLDSLRDEAQERALTIEREYEAAKVAFNAKWQPLLAEMNELNAMFPNPEDY